MEAEDNEELLEEGEISDDSDTYTPLERPVNYSITVANPRFPQVLEESDSEPEQSSDTDSSDSSQANKKVKKVKIKPKPQASTNSKRKKYDIWSTRVQEDVLSETLNSCDVSTKDRSRDVETYDYLGNHFYARESNKRSRDDRKNPNLMSVGRKKGDSKEHKGNPRIILDLAVDLNDSPLDEIARDMANKLCEEREDLILKIINALGLEKAISVFKETKRIEEDGGMMIMNQTRRRTPGGVFLFLVRMDEEVTAEQKDVIFDDDKQKRKQAIKMKKKEKLVRLKNQMAAQKAKLLPDLITRAELLASENDRSRKETDERDVINPPPTPETDGGHENSGDGMDENNEMAHLQSENKNERNIATYDDDFLDIGCSTDMDLF